MSHSEKMATRLFVAITIAALLLLVAILAATALLNKPEKEKEIQPIIEVPVATIGKVG